MKNIKILLMLIGLMATVSFIGCEDTKDEVVTPTTKQGAVIVSVPAGAQVVYGTKVLGVTPLTIDTLKAGTKYDFKLVMTNFNDSAIAVTPTASKIDTVKKYLSGKTVTYTAIVVFESSELTANHPSGLSFSLGKAISYTTANKDSVDLFYFSDRSIPLFEIRTPGFSTAPRVTAFLKGGTSLTDGASSTVKDASWITKYSASDVSNYYFAYDNDKHYSKIKIIEKGGFGIAGDPAWVKFEWIYNKAVDNVYFK